MRYRKLSPTGDYTFGGGLANFYIDEPAAVGQAVKTGLLLWRGEWSFDTSQGVPYLDSIIGKHTTAEADQEVQNQILETTGVTAIRTYESERDTVARAFSVQAEIDTEFGPTEVTLQNYVNY